MKPRRQTLAGSRFAAYVLLASALIFEWSCRHATVPFSTVTLEGDVLKQDSDPVQQTPLAGVLVTARAGITSASAQSGPTGLFRISLRPLPGEGEPVVLTFKHADYKPLEIVADHPGNQLYIARMQALQPAGQATLEGIANKAKLVELSNVRVRYSLKEESTVNVGSLAKEFTAHNLGNVPCRGRLPCSPDGRWAAYMTNLPLDAEDSNEFRNVRVLCVAGPCAFTKVEPLNTKTPARSVTVSVLNWSDTAVFLVEADVTRTMVTEAIQYAYPFIVGPSMSFALPAGSEGPSIEADVNGQYVVFPLGPPLLLPWANCSVEDSQPSNRIFRCQVKAGYGMRE